MLDCIEVLSAPVTIGSVIMIVGVSIGVSITVSSFVVWCEACCVVCCVVMLGVECMVTVCKGTDRCVLSV